jgi:hypothetical protein
VHYGQPRVAVGVEFVAVGERTIAVPEHGNVFVV